VDALLGAEPGLYWVEVRAVGVYLYIPKTAFLSKAELVELFNKEFEVLVGG
jgi:hypothetical protein